jgi:hypothetical protein
VATSFMGGERVMLVAEPDLTARLPNSRHVSPANRARKLPLRVASKKLSRDDNGTSSGISDQEGAMCWRSASEYDLYARTSSRPARTNSRPARSLVEVLRELFRPRRPQVDEAEVVPFPGRGRTDKEVDREGSKAA